MTQYFHIPRTRLALEKFGLGPIFSAYPSYFEARDVYSTARELPPMGNIFCAGRSRTEECALILGLVHRCPQRRDTFEIDGLFQMAAPFDGGADNETVGKGKIFDGICGGDPAAEQDEESGQATRTRRTSSILVASPVPVPETMRASARPRSTVSREAASMDRSPSGMACLTRTSARILTCGASSCFCAAG